MGKNGGKYDHLTIWRKWLKTGIFRYSSPWASITSYNLRHDVVTLKLIFSNQFLGGKTEIYTWNMVQTRGDREEATAESCSLWDGISHPKELFRDVPSWGKGVKLYTPFHLASPDHQGHDFGEAILLIWRQLWQRNTLMAPATRSWGKRKPQRSLAVSTTSALLLKWQTCSF